MAPTLPPASVALTDLRRRTPRDGGVFVLGPEDRPTMRRLVSDGDGWLAAPDNPDWASGPMDPEEILGEALWRSTALPPATSEGGRRPCRLTRMATEGLQPWAVPYRGRLAPREPREFEPDRAAWFEIGFLRSLGINPLNAETVTVVDASMEPLLWPGSAVLVDHRRQTPRDGAVYALWTGGGLVLRSLVQDGQRYRIVALGDGSSRPLRGTDEIVGEAVWSAGFIPGSSVGVRAT